VERKAAGFSKREEALAKKDEAIAARDKAVGDRCSIRVLGSGFLKTLINRGG
jgi:hypothetical protein